LCALIDSSVTVTTLSVSQSLLLKAICCRSISWPHLADPHFEKIVFNVSPLLSYIKITRGRPDLRELRALTDVKVFELGFEVFDMS